MKSTLIATAIAGLMISTAHAAPANDGFFFKPSVGVDYQYTSVDYPGNLYGTGVNGDDVANDSIHGVNIHIGVRVHKNLGFEAGYLWSDDASKSNILGTGLDSEVDVSGFNFDALGYLPVADNGRFELIGTVGITHLTAEFNIPTVGSVDETETNFRIGGGAQYWLTDNVNIRGLVRYQGADFDDSVDGAIIANAGLNFQF